MCGICGMYSPAGSAISAPLLEQMNAALAHRGPDSAGRLVDGPAGLAMQRLSIIDLAGGDQPISNEAGDVHVIQNGELYNYRELREQLSGRGHDFRTDSDTEILVHLYEEEGPALFARLRGMFAVAVWDARRRRLVLARDRFGIKPLYYRHVGGELSFASELKALLADPRVSRELDLDALEAYLALNAVPAPLSIFREIRKLPAGHVLVADERGVTVDRYARPAPEAVESLRTEPDAELAEELREVLRDSVRAHLVADVPVGVMLSGGVDSSALVALASEEMARVQTFSIGFDERSYDERRLARLVADRYGTDHHELVVRPQALELLPALVETYDEPFADSSAVPTYLVSKLASQHVKVALSGEGGDELFGGYYTYVADLLAPRIGPFARALQPLIERLPTSGAKASFDYKAKRFARAAHLPPLERHHGWKEIFSADARAELLRPERRAVLDPVDLLRARYAETAGAAPLARLQDVDVGIYLADDLLVKTDRASMAHSLEARVPFCDERVARFAFSLPDRSKVRGWQKKRLLRQAVEPLVPREIVHGRKQGFSIPNALWLRNELQPLLRDMLSPARLQRQGLFRPETVGPLIDRHVSGREDLSRQLWSLLVFSLWYERWVESPAATAAA